jgi:antitoxin (DNA-binding transcriptional repressor) of toxin-antitoxin stability system
MPDTVTVHVAKTRLSQLLARVEGGETIIIARGKASIARLVPLAPKPKRRFGAMRGLIDIDPSFLEPLPEEELAAWE